jgi:hypothetical protein
MMKSVFILLVVLFIAIPLFSAKKDWKAVETKDYPSLNMNNADIQSGPKPYSPVITRSPGMKVGDTWYDEQHNGTISKMIVRHPSCANYFWMKGFDSANTNRHVWLNFDDPPNDSIGFQIDPPGVFARSGYITGDIILSDGRPVPAYQTRLNMWDSTDFASVNL